MRAFPDEYSDVVETPLPVPEMPPTTATPGVYSDAPLIVPVVLTPEATREPEAVRPEALIFVARRVRISAVVADTLVALTAFRLAGFTMGGVV